MPTVGRTQERPEMMMHESQICEEQQIAQCCGHGLVSGGLEVRTTKTMRRRPSCYSLGRAPHGQSCFNPAFFRMPLPPQGPVTFGNVTPLSVPRHPSESHSEICLTTYRRPRWGLVTSAECSSEATVMREPHHDHGGATDSKVDIPQGSNITSGTIVGLFRWLHDSVDLALLF
jgi:hypothetical protein